jgi:hypothetical protein
VGALISINLIVLHAISVKWGSSWGHRLTFAIACTWALGMLAFAGTYGNALSAQQQYESRITSQLSNDLAQFKATNDITSYLFDGSAGLSPRTARAAETFPLISSLIRPYLSGEEHFYSQYFMDLYDTGLNDTTQHNRIDRLLRDACDAPVRYIRNGYVLRIVDATAIVTFPGGQLSACSMQVSKETGRRNP